LTFYIAHIKSKPGAGPLIVEQVTFDDTDPAVVIERLSAAADRTDVYKFEVNMTNDWRTTTVTSSPEAMYSIAATPHISGKVVFLNYVVNIERQGVRSNALTKPSSLPVPTLLPPPNEHEYISNGLAIPLNRTVVGTTWSHDSDTTVLLIRPHL
jgi:hypothetical protein